ncbi:MAG: amidase [Mesorhizobium sp.]|nr:MAG: amidase [Mesorhizobium sp.]RWM85814.1 MAG: amidase [Mesorhizobium sp.]TIO13945.1 MAG: amidase [Mesorhizobium sp.]TIP90467.1 MAG: amidase [Mesorhizobium sp.]
MDMLAQAALVQTNKASPRELVDAAWNRIDRLNPAINAVIRHMRQEAEDTLAAGQAGPFAGVPFLIKDISLAYAGVPTSAGSPLLADIPEPVDSELMARYRRAGLVTLGKTNTCEFGTLGTTEPILFGPCRNPWDLQRSSGGSSGGSAAAVAARMVPVAHANDGAGSIRIPASCCGLFGLKPSKGRISYAPKFGEGSVGAIGAEHCVSITVRDSAALLDATEGPMPGDPYMAPRPQESFLSQTERPPRSLKIAVTDTALLGTRLERACVEAVHSTARLCEELGHTVEFVEPKFDYEAYERTYRRFWTLTATRTIHLISQATGMAIDTAAAHCEAFNKYLYEHGKAVTAGQYLLDIVFFNRFAREMAAFLTKYDVWLTPTLGTVPPLLGHFDAAVHGGDKVMDRFMEFLPFTPFANMTGEPAMTVPLFWDENGMPVGSHFTASYGQEGLLFALARQLEQARPWADRLPEVSA